MISPPSQVELAPRATDTNIGSARQLQNQSASTVLSTLGPAAGYAFAAFVAFLILRRIYPRVYYPRAFIDSLRRQERSPNFPNNGLLAWMSTYYKTNDLVVLNTHTLDGYLFLRHLKLAAITCVVGIMITFPILLPVNATGYGKQTQLNILTLANAAGKENPGSYYRYYAHAFCAYLFFGFVIHMIARETIFYINLRQAYLVSPLYANRISSRTVLFTSTPEEYLNPDVIRRLFGEDVVRHVWIPRQVNTLVDAVNKRDKLAMKLEKAEIAFIKKCLKSQRQSKQEDNVEEPRDDLLKHITSTDEHRPKHRTGFLGLFGKKVDTIKWCKEELSKALPEVEELQRDHRNGNGKPMNSVFVEFESLRDAQSAYQALTHHESLHMAPRYTGIAPGEIVWSNLRIHWFERIIRFLVTTSFWIGLIVFWSVPVAFISSISSVGFLSGLPGLQWLGFLYRLPSWLSGLVTGLLPSILLSLVMTILPPILRLAHQLSGDPTLSTVEYSLQNSYFWFYIIQVFLVTTLSNGAFKAAEQIYRDPSAVISLLADALPSSSNFYLSYIVLQGLGVVASTLATFFNLLLWLLSNLFHGTPRAMYKSWITLNNPGMGSLFPIYTTMFIIAISYSCIAPLVLAFGAIGLLFFYLAYRYEFLYVYNVSYDTKGLMYARALQQLFVGLYLAELCLIGLFSINIPNSRAVLGPLVLMIILLVFTIICHVSLNSAFQPLLSYLPKTLETEEQRLLAAELEDGQEVAEKEPKSATYDGALSDLRGVLPGLKHWQKRHQNKKENPGMIRKWFRPSVYQDYYTLRKLVPRDFAKIEYAENTEVETYFHPAVTSLPPTLWIPRDSLGLSKRECEETSQVIPISDEGAHFDEKGKIFWDQDRAGEMPITAEKIYW